MFSVDGNDGSLNTSLTQSKLEAMQRLGVPYSDEYIANWETELSGQAEMIAEELNKDPNIDVQANEEIVALIAYLQRLGTDIKKSETLAENN
jgi:cytochrome c oxidase cbb3-type subunit I/II